jgi:hypothetical protein
MPRVVYGIKSCKSWWDVFVAVKRQGDDSGTFEKETGFQPTPPQALDI